MKTNIGNACKDCKGRGRWAEIEESISTGESHRQWRYCQTCNGSGIEQDPESGDDYDIGGDSYADED